MTVDERLAAVTPTLELTARMQKDFRAQNRGTDGATSDAVRARAVAAAERFKRIEENLIEQGEVVARVDRQLGEFALHTAEWVEKIDLWIEGAETRIAELQVLVRTAHERLDQGR